MKKALVLILVFVLAASAGIFLIAPYVHQTLTQQQTPPPVVDQPPPEPEYIDIDIACIGDILIHEPVFNAAKISDSEYDFKPQFTYVKPLLEEADLTIANMEGTLAGPRYTGYPVFSCPDSIVDALKDSGVDILTSANNHCMDKGQAGFFRTIETIRSRELDVIGIRQAEEEPPYVIKTVNGIKVGVINYGYASQSSGGSVQVNGLPMPSSMSNLLNFIDYSRLSSQLEKLHTTIASIREEGVDVLILCMHWGNEYQTHSDSLQQRTAQELANLDVDIIFGGHPHVLQEASYVTSENSDHQTLVYYSLGNFISNQRQETVSLITEHGMIAQVSLRHHKDGSNEILNSGYTATWVNKKTVSSKTLFEVVPANEALENMDTFPNLRSSDRSRLETCRNNVDNLMTGITP